MRWVVLLTCLFILGCQEIDSIVLDGQVYTKNIVQLAPINPNSWEQGNADSANFIATFESEYGYPFGGDGSILCWLVEFNIPLRWNIWLQTEGGEWLEAVGEEVTMEDYGTWSAYQLTMGTSPNLSACTIYQWGVLDIPFPFIVTVVDRPSPIVTWGLVK